MRSEHLTTLSTVFPSYKAILNVSVHSDLRSMAVVRLPRQVPTYPECGSMEGSFGVATDGNENMCGVVHWSTAENRVSIEASGRTDGCRCFTLATVYSHAIRHQ